jgi:hypothetical protein
MKNLKNSILVFIAVLSCSNTIFAKNGIMPVDDKELKLPGGKKIVIKRVGDHSQTIYLKKKGKIVWQKTFEEEYDRLWDYAFFVPIKKKNKYY